MPVLSTDVVIEGAKCEELEKVITCDDKENFFRSKSNCLLGRKKS